MISFQFPLMNNKFENSTILARINFPLYSIQFLTCRHIIVAGGGGSANTGVSNGFEFYELLYNGENFNVREILRYETGNYVVMNCAAFEKNKHSFIMAGQENYCQLYEVQYSVCPEENCELNNSVRVQQRNHNPGEENYNFFNTNIKYNKALKLEILPKQNIETEFNGEEPLQKVVRINKKGTTFATSGTDGHIRIWNFPTMKLNIDIKAHEKEIDDIDFSPCGTQIVSVSKDGTAVIWDSCSGNKLHDLLCTPINGTKYLYKRCRYTIMDNDPATNCLYLIANPQGYNKKPAQIQVWNPAKGKLLKQTGYEESLSALATRNDGRFIAVGTMFTGTVLILASFSLHIILKIPDAHSMFITGLEFLPVCTSTNDNSFTTYTEASVISISVDNKICIHSLPTRDYVPFWVFLLLVLLTVISTFTICSFIGL